MPFLPELIGRKGLNIILGKMSGGTVIESKLEKLNLKATKQQISEIVERVKREAIIRKWSIPDYVFEKIAQDVLEGR
jgi:isopropylmalate/homocitrate/citramalate synthase